MTQNAQRLREWRATNPTKFMGQRIRAAIRLLAKFGYTITTPDGEVVEVQSL